jgi:hypothetical protein
VVAAVRAARTGSRRAGRERCPAAHPDRAAKSGSGRPRLPWPTSWHAGRAGSRLPPGHRMAVADRTVRRRVPEIAAVHDAVRRIGLRRLGRIWPNSAWVRSARPPMVRHHTRAPVARSRRGRSPNCFASARQTDPSHQVAIHNGAGRRRSIRRAPSGLASTRQPIRRTPRWPRRGCQSSVAPAAPHS